MNEPKETTHWLPDHRYGAGIEAGGVGVWWWDLRGKRVYWSPNLRGMRGSDPSALDGMIGDLRNDVHPDDRDRIFTAIRRSLTTGCRYDVEFRVSVSPERGSRWLEARGMPIVENGRIIGMTGICQDITAPKRAELELQRRVLQQDAVSRLGQAAIASHDMQAFLAEACVTVANALDVDLCGLLEFTGDRDTLLLRAGVGWKAAHIGAKRISAAGSHAAHVLDYGRPAIFSDLTADDRFDDTDLFADHPVAGALVTIVVSDDNRSSYGMIGAYALKARTFDDSDVNFLQSVANILAMAFERQGAQIRQNLLIRELRHRVGNIFAQVIALFNQTVIGASGIADLQEKYPPRIHALARAHSLISDTGWKPMPIAYLVKEALGPFVDQVEMTGGDIQIPGDEAYALTMALYELATNASKYGCLSTTVGRLAVAWRVRRENERVVEVSWRERGGPTVVKPDRRGFGSKLLRVIVERQLQGRIQWDFDAAGLMITLEFPLKDMARPEAGDR